MLAEPVIRRCAMSDVDKLYQLINESARAYAGRIPQECYTQPYMTTHELGLEFARVAFFGCWLAGKLVGVMGLESVADNTSLIRHAYVLPQYQRQGTGGGIA